jgi:DNA (cytosine-5)-methyltransferase 1
VISHDIYGRLRYLSVCDGIGAVHLAWQQLGWECVGISEIAPFPAAVVDHHFGFRNFGDLKNYKKWPERLLADVDLLAGGTPCQSFSVAGNRLSLDDKRGGLTRVYVDLFHHINRIRRNHGRSPTIALWENVPGVLSTKDNAFGCLLGGLLGLDEAAQPKGRKRKWKKAGFESSETARVAWRVLDGQYFAVAQRRRRVFLVAVPRDLVERFGEGACPSQILSLADSVPREPPTRESGRKETAGGPGEGLAGRIAGAEPGRQDCAPEVIAFNCNSRGSHLPSCGRDTSIASTLTASQRGAVAFVHHNRG